MIYSAHRIIPDTLDELTVHRQARKQASTQRSAVSERYTARYRFAAAMVTPGLVIRGASCSLLPQVLVPPSVTSSVRRFTSQIAPGGKGPSKSDIGSITCGLRCPSVRPCKSPRSQRRVTRGCPCKQRFQALPPGSTEDEREELLYEERSAGETRRGRSWQRSVAF